MCGSLQHLCHHGKSGSLSVHVSYHTVSYHVIPYHIVSYDTIPYLHPTYSFLSPLSHCVTTLPINTSGWINPWQHLREDHIEAVLSSYQCSHRLPYSQTDTHCHVSRIGLIWCVRRCTVSDCHSVFFSLFLSLALSLSLSLSLSPFFFYSLFLSLSLYHVIIIVQLCVYSWFTSDS